MQLLPLLVQVVVGVPPPLLYVHELGLQRGLRRDVRRQQQAPAGLYSQDVEALLPLEDSFFQLQEQGQRQRAERAQVY